MAENPTWLWLLGFVVTGIAIMVGIWLDPYSYEVNGKWVYAGWVWPMIVSWIVTWLIFPVVLIKLNEEERR